VASLAWIPRLVGSDDERGTGGLCFLDRDLGLGKMAFWTALGVRLVG